MSAPESDAEAGAESDEGESKNDGEDGVDAPAPPAEEVPFVESDDAATAMTYDHGKVPLYVAAVWLVLLISYAIYMVSLALPDLSAWGIP